VRQQSRRVEHTSAGSFEVVDSRGVAVRLEPLSSLRIAIFGIFPEREERLMAAGLRTLCCDLLDLVE
jgi:hypothetical protein